MNKRNTQLNQLHLPAVRAGMPVTVDLINKTQDVISVLQKIHKIKATIFVTVKAGDPLKAELMNRLYHSVNELNDKLGIAVGWNNYPVKSGDSVTEKLINELLGSVNSVIRNTNIGNVDIRHYIKFFQLKSSLSEIQLIILNIVSEYYFEHDAPIFSRKLFGELDVPKIKDVINDIGGEFIFESSEKGKKCYSITFLGVMLTDKYSEIEELLVRYLEFIKNKFIDSPESERILGEEVNTILNLSAKESNLLRNTIYLSPFLHGSMGIYESGGWDAAYPDDVEELRFVDDMRDYIYDKVLDNLKFYRSVSEVDRINEIFKLQTQHTKPENNQNDRSIPTTPPIFIQKWQWIKQHWKENLFILIIGFLVYTAYLFRGAIFEFLSK